MIRIAICDDCPADCETIKMNIHKLMDDTISYDIYTFHSSVHFMQELEQNSDYDLIFLDYEMDGYNGVDVGMKIRSLGNHHCLIIYISNHSGIITQILDVGIHNFIEKPVSFPQFEKVFASALHRIIEGGKRLRITKSKIDSYIVKSDITYIEFEWRSALIHTIHDIYTTYEKMDSLEQRLDGPFKNFVRIHQSYIVNLDFAQDVGSKKIKLYNGKELDISYGFQKSFKEKCHQLSSDPEVVSFMG